MKVTFSMANLPFFIVDLTRSEKNLTPSISDSTQSVRNFVLAAGDSRELTTIKVVVMHRNEANAGTKPSRHGSIFDRIVCVFKKYILKGDDAVLCAH